MTIVTNNVPRDILDSWDLTPKEREQFDYLDWDKLDKGEDSASFFRYKGELYDLGWFMRFTSAAPEYDKWDGHYGTSYFSAILVKLTDDQSDVRVIVGYAYE